jgi:hypothetical protein
MNALSKRPFVQRGSNLRIDGEVRPAARTRVVCAAVAGAIVLSMSQTVRADVPAAAPAPAAARAASSLSDAEVRERTDFLIERLDARRKHATWYYRSWMTVYTLGITFGSLQAGLADGEGDRAENIVSAVKSTIGLSNLLFRPLEARHGADSVRALPGESAADRLARLERAEAQLAENADRAAEARNWQSHLSNVALNLAGGAVLLIGGSPRRAAVSAGVGMTFGEVSILTEPVTPAEDWEAYESQYGETTWTLAPFPGGLAFHATF